MIIPSIDIMDGQAVQLEGGRELVLSAGDPCQVAERFARAGELALIDLDAALGRGDNHRIISQLVATYPCRVGGGIRSARAALDWLDRGARQVILGTAATPEVLSQFPTSRVMVALDGFNGEVVVEGWRAKTGAQVIDRLDQLQGLAGAFLVTFVEREGRLGGIDLDAVARVVTAAKHSRVTVAGGITSGEEVAAIDRLGADAQVGMALYTDRLHLADAVAAPLLSDRPDGLWPTVVVDEGGVALGLAYSDRESLRAAIDQGRGIYRSRSRGLWRKGESSGNTQQLLRVDLDCDRDTLRFVVRQTGAGFCHHGTATCWGPDHGLSALERRLGESLAAQARDSYTVGVASDAGLLAAKLAEEAAELGAAGTRDEVIWEAADVIYFTAVTLASHRISTAEVIAELDRRGRLVRRRDGSAYTGPGSRAPGGRQ